MADDWILLPYGPVCLGEGGYFAKLPVRTIRVLDDKPYLDYFANGGIIGGFMEGADVWGEDLTAYEGVAGQKQTFRGYVRQGRGAGIRNEIYIIPSVGCVNNVRVRLADAAQSLLAGTLDGIYALTHPFGCSQLGQDQENIKQLLASIALHPNASFVLFVGLGCENNGLNGIRQCLADQPTDHIAWLTVRTQRMSMRKEWPFCAALPPGQPS